MDLHDMHYLIALINMEISEKLLTRYTFLSLLSVNSCSSRTSIMGKNFLQNKDINCRLQNLGRCY